MIEGYKDMFCKCGCDKRIRKGLWHSQNGIPQYIHGHNRKGKKHTKVAKIKLSKLLSGKNHPNWGNFGKNSSNWKGGKHYQDGYVMVYKPKHPNCMSHGYIMEHRLVVEKHLGKYLSATEEVHHINNVRDDNRIENLKLFKDTATHSRYHREKERLGRLAL